MKNFFSIKQKQILIFILVSIFAVLSVWIYIENSKIKISEYSINSKNVPNGFNNFKIVQISDFHNSMFGKNQSDLISKLNDIGPDIIVITGDLIDSRKTDIDAALLLIQQAVEICPVYYVTGNHEYRVQDEYALLEAEMKRLGVQVLHNESAIIEHSGQEIMLIGMDDPFFFSSEDEFIKTLSELYNKNYYTILLSHRPELFEEYCSIGTDLVFSGHAHGGQIRFPFIGAVIAPNQGLFPKYTNGTFTSKGTAMVVSRGLGNSLIPFRINNPPELVVVTLKN